MSKVCLPVAIAEPLNVLQRSAEMMINFPIVKRMVTEKDSCKRLVFTTLVPITHFTLQKSRFKKPFNPILGETFELATEDFRYLSE